MTKYLATAALAAALVFTTAPSPPRCQTIDASPAVLAAGEYAHGVWQIGTITGYARNETATIYTTKECAR